MKKQTKTITKDIEVYIADDGTEFENGAECEQYEDELNFKRLISESIFAFEDGKLISKSDFENENWQKELEDLYNIAHFIYFKNQKQKEIFETLVCVYLELAITGLETDGLKYVYSANNSSWIDFENLKSIFNSMEEMLSE